MKQNYFTPPGSTFRLQPISRTTALFLLLFLLNFFVGFGQEVIISSDESNFTTINPVPVEIIFEKGIDEIDPNKFQYVNGDLINFERQYPKYINQNSDMVLSQFTVQGLVSEFFVGDPTRFIEESVISISLLNESMLWFLTYGNGVKELNLNSSSRQDRISSTQFNSPLDLAISQSQKIFVADKEDYQVKIYKSAGVRISEIGNEGVFGQSEDEFYGPTGLAIDNEDNLYVADAFTGQESGIPDRIKIYDEDQNFINSFPNPSSSYNLVDPYRVAVDNLGRIYVADVGGSTDFGRVQIFELSDNNYELIHTIEGTKDNIGAPGSIVVDDFGYIYIVDYEEDITFGGIFENPLDLLLGFNTIKDKNFSVNVYDSQFNYVGEFNDGLNLPIDLEIDQCGNILVNDLNMDGSLGATVNINFDFQLKTFSRKDTFTADFDIDRQCEIASFTIPASLENKANCYPNPVSEESFRIILDETAPEIKTCDANDKIVPSGFVVPDYIDNGKVSFNDNCGEQNLTYIQIPKDGETITENTTVTITATDEAGNVSDACSFTLIVQGEEALFIDCPNPQILDMEGNCEKELPNYTTLADYADGAKISQNPEQGTLVSENQPIELTAELNGETISCSFQVIVKNQAENLSIICSYKDTQVIEIPASEDSASFEFDDPEVSGGCGTIKIEQTDGPASGEIFNLGTTTIGFTVTDESGTSVSCSFKVLVEREGQTPEPEYTCIPEADIPDISLDDDCTPQFPDYTKFIETENFTPNFTQIQEKLTEETYLITIEIRDEATGELVGECSFSANLIDSANPVASCVSGFVVNLDNTGNASIAPEDLNNNSTDNCGIDSMALSQTNFTTADIGEVSVTLTVRDEAGNMDSCETRVEVVDNGSGTFECLENVILSLDENGKASLNLQDLYTGDASELSPEASRLNFDCSDLGGTQIQLDYTGGSCMINVEVRDELPPWIITDIVELSLDNDGFAYLKENDVLAEDNCSEELIYRFSKSVFTCKDVGYNVVTVEVEDANGYIGEKVIELNISGEACEISQDSDIEFPILYPNPSDGIFTIATPEGMFIERIRVFDSRGRYIMQKDYNGDARFYRMSIQVVAESVYTLHIFTNEGVIVKRAIIKR